MAILVSSLSGGGNKPIQRGKATISTSAGLSVDVTISAVVINKTTVIVNAVSASTSAGTSSAGYELVNTTTLRLFRGLEDQSTDFYWQVIESN